MSVRGRELAWLLTAAIAATYLLLAPLSNDLAAQMFRTDLFEQVGFTLWNAHWFGGHHVPGYSVLFPPLAALLGPRLVGAAATIAAAVVFERLARERFGARATVGVIWFAAASTTNLFTGRLTFALGVAIALGALYAAQQARHRLALALAALCSLASPVAGLFLALAALAWAIADPSRARAWLAAVPVATAAAMSFAFPEGGVEPFALSAYLPIVALALAVLRFAPREHRALRVGAVLYAVAATAAFVLDTPMGGNAARLGTLFAGPVAACVLWGRRPALLATLALPLLWWQWSPAVRDLAAASGDPAGDRSYYASVNEFLNKHAAPGARVEVPPTRNHWESVFVGRRFPLARGWERQLDIKYNRLFYRQRLRPARYRAWLWEAGVHYVAVPDARLDYAAEREVRMIERGVPFLEPVWSDAHWRVYRVRGPAPPVLGPAELISMTPDSFTLRAQRPGVSLVRVRYSPYWEIVRGTGCVAQSSDGFTRVRASSTGRIRVATSFSPDRLVDRGPRCRTTG